MLWLVLLACLAVVRSECPNGCSSHGKCGAYDMCQCYRNWMANDCSERKSLAPARYLCLFLVARIALRGR